MLVSEDQEIAMGRQTDGAVVASIGLYDDPVWQRCIQQFGARLAAASERPNLPWTFRVVGRRFVIEQSWVVSPTRRRSHAQTAAPQTDTLRPSR